jgi:CRP/FNR family cyclic AMP-dependent transcriptional regulator
MNTIASNALKCAPLFGDLSEDEVAQIASLFKARNFSKGDIVVKEGLGGAAFFVIRSGEALVSIGGEPRATLSSGDFFGEIALFDEGTRMATITAATDLNCYGLTYWDFRPLVEENGVIGWKLLQRMAEMLRDTRKEQAE